MTITPVPNRAQFERAIERLIQAADNQNRGGDLDRIVAHLAKTPEGVSRLASFVLLLDEDFRGELSSAVESFRRFRESKGDPIDDDGVLAVMEGVYARVRAGS